MHKALEKEIEILNKNIATVRSWQDTAEDAENIIELAGKGKVSVNSPDFTSIEGVLIRLSINHRDEVLDILKVMHNFGYKQTKIGEYAIIQRLEWYYTKEIKEEPKQRIVIMAFLTGTACKFVEVGTKEEPVYELKCEEPE